MTREERKSNSISSSTSRTSSISSSSTTTTTIHTHPGVLLSPDQWEQLSEYYTENIGRFTRPVIDMIRYANNNGHMTYGAIMKAMEATALAPRPTAYYLQAVLQRAIGDSIETEEDWRIAELEYKANCRQRWYEPSRYER